MRRWVMAGAAVLLVAAVGMAAQHEEELGPPGPIRDRQLLMKDVGKHAKAVGDALKAHDLSAVARGAQGIAGDAPKIATLFPAGSTDGKSRAKPEIWWHWPKFEQNVKALGSNAQALAAAAQQHGNVGTAAKALFDTCKSCHDQFRKPEKKKAA
jgi:cytochrome c556